MDFAKLFNADGRVGRRDWIIWIVAIAIIFGIIGWLLGDRGQWVQAILAIIAGIAGIFMGIKRLHDLDKSGWFYLLGIVPIVSFFFAILSMPDSILGNEAALKFGRHRAITTVMIASAAVALLLGASVSAPAWVSRSCS